MREIEVKVRKPHDEYLKELQQRMKENIFYVPVCSLGAAQALGRLSTKTDLFLLARNTPNGNGSILLPKHALQITAVQERAKYTWFKIQLQK